VSPASARAVAAGRLLGALMLGVFSLSPLLPVLTRHWPAAAPLQRAFELWFDVHCERDPARTAGLWGAPLAVCVRCSGIYFGLGLGALLRRPRLAPGALRLWVTIGAALMLLDVILEEHGLHGSWPTLRLLSGLALAYPVGVGLGAALTRAPATAQSP
jgi:uncharacterized membrane protein